MKERMYTAGEIVTIRNNVRMIERNLGHEIPTGLISYDDLKDHLLKSGEIVTICNNIRTIEKGYHKSYSANPNTNSYSLLELLLGAALCGAVLLFFFILKSVFGIDTGIV